jgi:hypothetical protein
VHWSLRSREQIAPELAASVRGCGPRSAGPGWPDLIQSRKAKKRQIPLRRRGSSSGVAAAVSALVRDPGRRLRGWRQGAALWVVAGKVRAGLEPLPSLAAPTWGPSGTGHACAADVSSTLILPVDIPALLSRGRRDVEADPYGMPGPAGSGYRPQVCPPNVRVSAGPQAPWARRLLPGTVDPGHAPRCRCLDHALRLCTSNRS